MGKTPLLIASGLCMVLVSLNGCKHYFGNSEPVQQVQKRPPSMTAPKTIAARSPQGSGWVLPPTASTAKSKPKHEEYRSPSRFVPTQPVQEFSVARQAQVAPSIVKEAHIPPPPPVTNKHEEKPRTFSLLHRNKNKPETSPEPAPSAPVKRVSAVSSSNPVSQTATRSIMPTAEDKTETKPDNEAKIEKTSPTVVPDLNIVPPPPPPVPGASATESFKPVPGPVGASEDIPPPPPIPGIAR